ncbi:MAG: restriction endonuclease subunit S [Ignavibacteria bacterium]|nr:restriction endonuclease subunit S [Ignavibacteria bacterium]
MIKKYENYTESNIVGIDEIPITWQQIKLKYILSLKSGDAITSNELSDEYDFPVYGGNGIMGFTNRYIYENDKIIVGRVGAYCGNIHLAKGKIWVSDNALLIETEENLEYLTYLLKSLQLNKLANKNAQPLITGSMVKDQIIPFPASKTEQTKIAQYLDHQTNLIDQLIKQKEKQIELLKEYRQAVINEAVTKGLDPNAKMKDSGIEWLGEVPEGWEIRKLKHLVSLNSNEDDAQYLAFKVALENIESGTGKFVESNLESQFEGVGNYFKKGDVLFNKLRPYLAKVYLAQQDGYSVGELLVFSPKEEIISGFLFYRLLSSSFIEVVNGSTYGAKMPRASWSFIGNLSVVVPSKDEQSQIIDYIQKYNTKINKLISDIDIQIQKLKEYRQSIISEAVTGKIDVREWQIPDNVHEV